MASLSRVEKREAQQIFADGKACTDCGGIHHRACPRIKRKSFHPNGNLIEVEYWAEFDDTGVIWPEDAFDPSDPDDSDEGAANGR